MIQAHRLSALVLAFATRNLHLGLSIGPILLVGLGVADAQAPIISSLSPISLRPGQTQDVVVGGANLAGATRFWTTCPQRSILTPDIKNNGKNPGDVSFRVTLGPEAMPGLYGARVATDRGVSSLRIVLVDDLPIISRRPGNSTPAAAQPISLPSAVEGVAEPLVSQFFKFHVEAGQRLSLEIYARRIGSALDPTLRLFNAAGREIAYSDDVPGLSEDAAIDYTFRTAGDYIVGVEDNLYQGGGNYYYHLRIGDFPSAVVGLPLAAARGRDVTFHFADKSGVGTPIEPVHMKVPSDPELVAMTVPARFVGGAGGGAGGGATRSFATVLLTDRPQFTETEPNNEARSANRVELGGGGGVGLDGRLQAPGDVDRFLFHAKSGQTARFTAFARRLNSPADVVLRLTRPDGSQVGYAEGAASKEATLSTSFPADGDYILEVGDLNHRGGERYAYHIDVTPSDAGFSLSASADSLNIPAGGTAVIEVTAQRDRFNGPIAVRAVGLPAGVTSLPTVIGPGQDSALLTLHATSGASRGKVHPIHIVGSARVRNADFEASASVAEELSKSFAGMPYPPELLSSATAIGIGLGPKFALRIDGPGTIVFGKNLSATVKVIAERQTGFDEEIALAVMPLAPDTDKPDKKPKPQLPAGITATVKPIPKGASSVEIAFAADSKAQLAEFTAVLSGTLKKGNETITEPAPGVILKLEEPFGLSTAAVSAKLSRNGAIKFKIAARRNPAFKGAIALSLTKLPKGLKADPARIAAGATDVEIVLSASADAPPGPVKGLTVRGEAKVGNGKFSARVPVTGISIE